MASTSTTPIEDSFDDYETPPSTPTDSKLKEAIEDQIEHELALQTAGSGSRWLSLIRWDRFDAKKLVEAENALFQQVSTPITSRLVPIDLFDSTIYTITLKNENTDDSKIPYVLMHGFGGGVGIWASNLDALASQRLVHAIDMLGFGRSSRPSFSNDPALAEAEYVKAIEEWRITMNIEKMILVGHSFGGYLASAYALEYPSRLRHLILVDPWGYPVRQNGETKLKVPVWIRGVGGIASYLNPFTSLRVAGPYALNFIRKIRPDLGTRFHIASDPNAIYQYIYQINARKPSGERAFKTISNHFHWAHRPMILRIGNVDPQVPMTFVYGAKSWVDSVSGYETQGLRPNSYVKVNVIPDAGHHVYADNHEGFNAAMKEISQIIDEEKDVGQLEPLDVTNDEKA